MLVGTLHFRTCYLRGTERAIKYVNNYKKFKKYSVTSKIMKANSKGILTSFLFLEHEVLNLRCVPKEFALCRIQYKTISLTFD